VPYYLTKTNDRTCNWTTSQGKKVNDIREGKKEEEREGKIDYFGV